MGRTILESLIVAIAGLAFGLLGNALSPKGLELSRDYFPDAAAPGTPVEARLAEKGLSAIRFEEMRAIFEDPLREQGAYILVDARNDERFAEGHIPGAYQLDHYRVAEDIDAVLAVLPGAMRVVIYCAGGNCEDSEFAATHLLSFGVDPATLSIYVGGYEEWTAQGMPVETGP